MSNEKEKLVICLSKPSRMEQEACMVDRKDGDTQCATVFSVFH